MILCLKSVHVMQDPVHGYHIGNLWQQSIHLIYYTENPTFDSNTWLFG